MKLDQIDLLTKTGDVHDYVMALWTDGPIRRSHQSGGLVHDIVDRFARLPRLFYRPSDQRLEWTHFSAWWGAILLCDYDNPHIRDLRYLHEIYHSATMPYAKNLNLAGLEEKNFYNERQASTFTEMAIYLECPDLRPLTFEHPIFVDRFLFPTEDFSKPDPTLISRWRNDRQDMSKGVFKELLAARAYVVEAPDDKIDKDDPQTIWLRRYGEQGQNWLNVWKDRYQLVENAMIALAENTQSIGKKAAGEAHLRWLLSPEISDKTDIPFHAEAELFRSNFDTLISLYDNAMSQSDMVAVKNVV